MFIPFGRGKDLGINRRFDSRRSDDDESGHRGGSRCRVASRDGTAHARANQDGWVEIQGRNKIIDRRKEEFEVDDLWIVIRMNSETR